MYQIYLKRASILWRCRKWWGKSFELLNLVAASSLRASSTNFNFFLKFFPQLFCNIFRTFFNIWTWWLPHPCGLPQLTAEINQILQIPISNFPISSNSNVKFLNFFNFKLLKFPIPNFFQNALFRKGVWHFWNWIKRIQLISNSVFYNIYSVFKKKSLKNLHGRHCQWFGRLYCLSPTLNPGQTTLVLLSSFVKRRKFWRL